MAIQLAISSGACPDLELHALLQRAQEWGYDGVEISGLYGHLDVGPTSPLYVYSDLIHRQLAATGRTLAALNTGVSFCNSSPGTLAALTGLVRDAIRLAAGLGCPFVVVSGDRLPGQVSQERALHQTALALRELGAEAGRQRVTLLVRNAGFVAGSEWIWRLWDTIDVPAVRICWDNLEGRQAGDVPSVAIPRLAAALSLVHAADARLDGNGRPTRQVQVGTGDLNVPLLIELLRGVAYDGWLCVQGPGRAATRGEKEAGTEPFDPAAAGRFLRSELEKPPVVLTAYKGDDKAPRYAKRGARSDQPASAP